MVRRHVVCAVVADTYIYIITTNLSYRSLTRQAQAMPSLSVLLWVRRTNCVHLNHRSSQLAGGWEVKDTIILYRRRRQPKGDVVDTGYCPTNQAVYSSSFYYILCECQRHECECIILSFYHSSLVFITSQPQGRASFWWWYRQYIMQICSECGSTNCYFDCHIEKLVFNRFK